MDLTLLNEGERIQRGHAIVEKEEGATEWGCDLYARSFLQRQWHILAHHLCRVDRSKVRDKHGESEVKWICLFVDPSIFTEEREVERAEDVWISRRSEVFRMELV